MPGVEAVGPGPGNVGQAVFDASLDSPFSLRCCSDRLRKLELYLFAHNLRGVYDLYAYQSTIFVKAGVYAGSYGYSLSGSHFRRSKVEVKKIPSWIVFYSHSRLTPSWRNALRISPLL